ncbi:hypothetical protein BSKO_11475 [Bryopsis sp. KO-2023]|nr:hypothetical protein BSKO_11475 [Bryopsis sp. KO-2023]
MDEQKQRQAKAGRRAAKDISVRLPKTDESEDVHAEVPPSNETTPHGQGKLENPSLQNEAETGEGGKKWVGVSRRKAAQITKESDAKDAKQFKYDSDEDESTLEIPEMDDEGHEDITRVVAEAPKVSHTRLSALREIDISATEYSSKNKHEGVDLSLLTACLCSKEEVEEWDGVWEPEELLTDIASRINAKNSIASSTQKKQLS